MFFPSTISMHWQMNSRSRNINDVFSGHRFRQLFISQNIRFRWLLFEASFAIRADRCSKIPRKGKMLFLKNWINWIRFEIHKPKNAYFLIFTLCCNVYDICHASIAGQVIYNYYRCSLHRISWMLRICFFFLSFFVFVLLVDMFMIL